MEYSADGEDDGTASQGDKLELLHGKEKGVERRANGLGADPREGSEDEQESEICGVGLWIIRSKTVIVPERISIRQSSPAVWKRGLISLLL